tara:strand:- start:19 stop:498 length:480 start_codon:yes stop_codon:yes gene_type:complete
MRLIYFSSEIIINLQEPKWDFRSISMARKVLNICNLKHYGLSIILSNDKRVSFLNYKWKGKKKPTNVLSFPNHDSLNEKPYDNRHLGDIFLGYETLKREAALGNLLFVNHLSHLLIHGILHLKGYSHYNKINEKTMQKEEVRLLKILNVDNPYKTNRFV